MKHSSINPYDLLEVHPRASQVVIDAAYAALVRLNSDGSKGHQATVHALTEAHGIIGNPERRGRYDGNRGNIDGKVIGEYRILQPIAEGGFGKTYKGEHIRVGTPVCIKHCSRISPHHEAVLIAETQAMWDLRHFSIPAVRDLIKLEDGSLALVMSYIPGYTLEQVIEKVGRLDAETVAWIAERVLNVLKYIHYHGVIHGDLKPQNIIMHHATHQVTIVDFGLSLVKPKEGTDSKGYTEHFAPPEEIAGSTLLPESDFYSLGMTMLYALGGGLKSVKSLDVPKQTPEPLCEFIHSLIIRDVLSRPRWDSEDLCDSIQKVRERSFGRKSSGMKPIPGLD